jgi:hypothetical protein
VCEETQAEKICNKNGNGKEQKRLQMLEGCIMECYATLFHGNGHQSRTRCQHKHLHATHYAVYGSDGQEAHWQGDEASTGFFDEPPEGDKE